MSTFLTKTILLMALTSRNVRLIMIVRFTHASKTTGLLLSWKKAMSLSLKFRMGMRTFSHRASSMSERKPRSLLISSRSLWLNSVVIRGIKNSSKVNSSSLSKSFRHHHNIQSTRWNRWMCLISVLNTLRFIRISTSQNGAHRWFKVSKKTNSFSKAQEISFRS